MIQSNDTTNGKVLRVACYERVSTEEQARHGISIDAQTAALGSWVQEHGHILVGHYTDAGISGGAPISKRPAMSRLLMAVQAGQIDLVIFTKLDRWFRSLKNYYACQDILDAAHCAWQAIQEDYETLTASGRFKVNIMLSVAENERERTGERIKAVFDYQRAQGQYLTDGSAVPLGYIVEDKHLVKDPATMDHVQTFFDLALSGLSTGKAIARMRELYPNDYRAYCTYRRMLIKPVYAGIIHDIPDGCPAYITEDQHQMLLARAGTRSPTTGCVYIFTGLIHCPDCGGKLVCRKTNGDIKYTYYICNRAYTNRMCNRRICLREDRLEAALTAYIFDPGNLSLNSVEATQRPTRNAPTPSQIKAKLKRLAETYTDGLIDRDAYKRQTAELKEQLTAAEMPSRSPSEPPVALIQELIQGDIQSTYSGLSRQEKRRFWTRILQACTMDEEYQIKAITFFDS